MSNKTVTTNRKRIAIIALIGVLFLSGCLSATSEVTITSEGEINTLEAQIQVEDDLAWNSLKSDANQSGYDEIGEYLMAGEEDEVEEDLFYKGNWHHIEYEQSESLQQVEIYAEHANMSAIEDVSVEVDETNETVTFTNYKTEEPGDYGPLGHPLEDDVDITVKTTMPGEIIETNGAIETEDNFTASWNEIEQTHNYTVTSELEGNPTHELAETDPDKQTTDESPVDNPVYAIAGFIAILIATGTAGLLWKRF